jgi:hypothetical protein
MNGFPVGAFAGIIAVIVGFILLGWLILKLPGFVADRVYDLYVGLKERREEHRRKQERYEEQQSPKYQRALRQYEQEQEYCNEVLRRVEAIPLDQWRVIQYDCGGSYEFEVVSAGGAVVTVRGAEGEDDDGRNFTHASLYVDRNLIQARFDFPGYSQGGGDVESRVKDLYRGLNVHFAPKKQQEESQEEKRRRTLDKL